MITLEKLYEHCKREMDETRNFEAWFIDDFVATLEDLTYYNQCLLYNEYADKKHLTRWYNIEELNDWGYQFIDMYNLIDHDNFNTQDDIVIEENDGIRSYSYADFAEEYFNACEMAEFIRDIGLENLINNDIIASVYNYMEE